jgi:transposase
MFESHVVEVLHAASSISAAQRLLKLNWRSLQAIMARAVERGLERRELKDLRCVGLDEKSFRKGQDYITVLSDVAHGKVIDIVTGRTCEDAKKLLQTIPEPVRECVEAVTCDMWPAYVKAYEAVLPKAALVFDRYHIMSHMGKAVDQVRRSEHAILRALEDDTLKGTKYIWLRNPDNMSAEQFEQIEGLSKLNLKTSRAWALKESLSFLWECPTLRSATRHWKNWWSWAARCRLEPVKKVARMIKVRLPQVLNYIKHPITNAVAEGLNSKIQSLKSAARGFCNFVNYRVRVLFFCGKLDLSQNPAG